MGRRPRRLHRRPARRPDDDGLGRAGPRRGSGAGSASTRSWATTTTGSAPAGPAGPSAGPGSTDLEGRWDRLEVDGATLALGGTSEPWGPRLDYAAMPEADFRIVLSHSPDQFPRAGLEGVDLVLAGHNHGGQIRLPVLRPDPDAQPLQPPLRPRLLPLRRLDCSTSARGSAASTRSATAAPPRSPASPSGPPPPPAPRRPRTGGTPMPSWPGGERPDRSREDPSSRPRSGYPRLGLGFLASATRAGWSGASARHSRATSASESTTTGSDPP